MADAFFADDETGAPIPEVFVADFDRPYGTRQSIFSLGGPSLGNEIETSAAPGDSGGPAFVLVNDELLIGGINTFGSTVAFSRFTTFKGLSGGIVAPSIQDWIDGITGAAGTGSLSASGVLSAARYL